jgi:hypothetical protein
MPPYLHGVDTEYANTTQPRSHATLKAFHLPYSEKNNASSVCTWAVGGADDEA